MSSSFTDWRAAACFSAAGEGEASGRRRLGGSGLVGRSEGRGRQDRPQHLAYQGAQFERCGRDALVAEMKLGQHAGLTGHFAGRSAALHESS
jgi:hypothetical protein